MRYSYNEFIKMLKLVDTDLSKTIYELYLDCMREQLEKNK